MPIQRKIAALVAVIVSLLGVAALGHAKVITEKYPGGIAGVVTGMRRVDVVRALGAPSRKKFRNQRCPQAATDYYYDSKRLRLHLTFRVVFGYPHQCIPQKYDGYTPVVDVDTRAPAQKTERGIAVGSSRTELLNAYYRGHHSACPKGAPGCTVYAYDSGCETDDGYVETVFFLRTVSGTTRVSRISQDISGCTGY
jgi:hypothetical protein